MGTSSALTIHYHGTPITPHEALLSLSGRHFCVSFANPQDVRIVHKIGQSVMLDNGAFSFWRSGRAVDWAGFYTWAEPWLDFPTTWVVIPDSIEGGVAENDLLLAKWYQTRLPNGAPVWHMHEPLDRLRRLCGGYAKVCIGSSAEFTRLGTPAWHERIELAMDAVCVGRTPWLHMLRGMNFGGGPYPFASVDSTDIGRNHKRPQNSAQAMAHRWDSQQCPATWGIPLNGRIRDEDIFIHPSDYMRN